jgi:hypothetical protein
MEYRIFRKVILDKYNESYQDMLLDILLQTCVECELDIQDIGEYIKKDQFVKDILERECITVNKFGKNKRKNNINLIF